MQLLTKTSQIIIALFIIGLTGLNLIGVLNALSYHTSGAHSSFIIIALLLTIGGALVQLWHVFRAGDRFATITNAVLVLAAIALTLLWPEMWGVLLAAVALVAIDFVGSRIN